MSERVSVIIPLYNKVRHIRRSIDSVLGQSYSDFELIVVDDGSTDGGGSVVLQCDDPRVRLVEQENAGVSAARNRGISETTAELVAFLDADDEWRPLFLETVMRLREAYPFAGIYATGYQYAVAGALRSPNYLGMPEGREGGIIDDYFFSATGSPPVWSSAVMIPKEVLDQVGGFPLGVGRGEDLTTWVKIALRYFVAWSPHTGAVYHLDSENRACSSAAIRPDVSFGGLLDSCLASGVRRVSSHSSVKEFLAYWRLRKAKELCLHGKKAWAWDLVKKSRGTRMFQKQRIAVTLLILVPRLFVLLAQKARARRDLGVAPD